MWLARAVPVVGVAVLLGGPATAATPAPATDVAPVLTSTPFAAPPGQPVTHTITLSGAGTGVLARVRVTFTTTVGLDGVTASASPGSCPVVTPLRVACDLGSPGPSDADAATAKVTITGTVRAATAPGTLVQNLVSVTSGAPDTDPSNDVASNAYLVAGASAAPARPPASGPAPAPSPSGRAAPRPAGVVPVVALLALGALATAALTARWRRRRS